MVNSDNWPYFVLAVKLARPMLLGGERNMTCVGRTLVVVERCIALEMNGRR